MKRKLIVFWALWFWVFLFSGVAQSQPKFSLKLCSGYGTLRGGDFNIVLEGMNAWFKEISRGPGSGMEGEFKKLNWGMDLEGELIINLTENFGFSLGGGYIRRAKDSAVNLKFDEPSCLVTYKIEPLVRAVPIKVSAYLFYPLVPKMNVFLNGGVGYYFSKISYKKSYTFRDLNQLLAWQEVDGEMRDNGFGFHGGGGFEINLVSNIAFFVEGVGRYAKLKDLRGDETWYDSEGSTEKNSGTLWYYEYEGLESGKYYPQLTVSKERPADNFPYRRNIRKAELDLSGFSLRGGIRIKF